MSMGRVSSWCRRVDRWDPADLEERMDTSVSVKSMLGLDGTYDPLTVVGGNILSGVVKDWIFEIDGDTF